MRMFTTLLPLLVVASTPNLAQTPATLPAPLVDVVMQTELGAIQLQLDAARAPITTGNFLRYVDQKRFDGTRFYRAMKIGDSGEYGLVQAGLRGNPQRVFRPIAHEPTTQTGLSHVSGAISMARADPGTATADFFIVQGDLTGFDASATDPGYAAFGRVTAGMEVVRAMLELPRSDTAPVAVMKGQMLAKPVKIQSVRRLPAASAPTTVAPTPLTP